MVNANRTSRGILARFAVRPGQNGSAMLIVVIGVTVLSIIIGSVLFSVTGSYRTTTQAADWQESLLTAETGADFALASLRKTITDPANAWAGWKTEDSNGIPLANNGRTYELPALRASSGAGGSGALVQVDSPASLGPSASGPRWWRIRSTGSALLSGGSGVGADKRDGILRRLSFRTDRKTGAVLSVPQASRLVEVVARPSSFENAIVAQGRVAMNNWQIVVDSYDSRDPAKSTGGKYDAAKRQQNGDVATNGQIVDAGSAQIYGSVLTNDGTITGAQNITGEQRTDFYQELLPVQKPTWSATSGTPTYIDSTTTVTGGTKDSPTRVKVGAIKLEGGNKTLTLAPPATGGEGYIEIWVVGDIDLSGNGAVNIKANTNVKIYVEGSVKITGNGMVNETQRAPNLQLLGVTPLNGATPSFSLAGNGSFTGAVYAPSHAIALSGGGSDGNYYGSIVGNTVSMSGHTAVHYDEALSTGDFITDFKVASWFEDNR